MGSDRQKFVPQPNTPSPLGSSAYQASSNIGLNTNVAPAPAAAADVSLALSAPLTSRTGGRFRVAGHLSGAATAADQVTATLETNVNGAGFTAVATQLIQVSAAAGARFAVAFDFITAAVTKGQTIDARIRCVDATGNNITAGTTSGQVHINAQEIPA